LANLAAIFIADNRRRLAVAIVWLLVFLTMVGASVWIGYGQIAMQVRDEARKQLDAFAEPTRNVVSTFTFMHANVTAEPCSDAFQEQLRVVAYLPDGLNGFLYAPGGVAHCSVSTPRFEPPVEFGAPDIDGRDNDGRSLWLDHDLAELGLPELSGTIVASEPFATIVPPWPVESTARQWKRIEMGFSVSGRWWHRAGVQGLYENHLAAHEQQGLGRMLMAPLYRLYCEEGGLHCVVLELDLRSVLGSILGPMLLALVGSAAAAGWAAHEALRCMRRYWSFEARFLRHFGYDTVQCAYQPVLQLSDGHICGCEVLVRWRDVDGSIVSPDRFLPIVERRDLTHRLNQIVAEKAFAEIGSLGRRDHPLQVSFNVFPRDLDHGKLIPLYSGFLADRERFSVVVEVIESEAMPLESAQAEIEALLEAGIFTHIDDFGVGYSNIHNIAALSVHAVKIDRAFAMAPEGSILDRMLLPAIGMIRTAGHLVCVEGVESAERLKLLSSKGVGADFAQGYHISRPLWAADFERFLAEHRARPDRFRKAA
jgi:sensor c-di-GMP phosphodiesterase-like protein